MLKEVDSVHDFLWKRKRCIFFLSAVSMSFIIVLIYRPAELRIDIFSSVRIAGLIPENNATRGDKGGTGQGRELLAPFSYPTTPGLILENNATSGDKGGTGRGRELLAPFSYPTTPGKFLVFRCTGSDICGGLADRQRGLVSTFLLAVVTRRRFLVLLDTPCPLSNFYVPNRYDWSFKPELLDKRTTRTIAAIDGGNKGFFTQLQTGNFSQLYPEDVVYLQTNNQLQKFIIENPLFQPLLPLWATSDWNVFFKNAWEILMQPSDVIKRRLKVFLESVDFSHRTNPLVCAHLRIGASPTLGDVLVYNNVASLGPVWDLVTSYVQNGSQLFLATDNTEVRNISRTRYGAQHHDVAEVILNIDQSRSLAKACQGFEDAVLDQLILTYGDVLITTRSGFSETAAILRASNHSLFKFRDNKLSVDTLASVYVLLPI